MDPALAFRIAAAGFVATALIVAVFDHNRAEAPPAPSDPPVRRSARAADPQRLALRRCQSLGAGGAQNTDCLALWAQERDRFLAPAHPEAR